MVSSSPAPRQTSVGEGLAGLQEGQVGRKRGGTDLAGGGGVCGEEREGSGRLGIGRAGGEEQMGRRGKEVADWA